MKNLILQKYRSLFCSEFNLEQIGLFCIDPQTGDSFLYKEGVIYKYENIKHNLEIYCDLNSYFEENCAGKPLPVVIGFCYNYLSEALCVVWDNGDIVTIHSSENFQCVDSVGLPAGIGAIEWSLDQEVIALVVGQRTVIVMSGCFDIVHEVNLNEVGFGEKQFVNVGWGKKETQFHGSEGKAAALSKLEQQTNDTQRLYNDDKKPRISWRGDGTLFAVSILEDNGERCIRVFSRDGILQYTSEVVNGLEASLSWRPSGNLIAATQRLPNKHQVVFFEKNGLRHGEFTLPVAPDDVEVHHLTWNDNSTILAVLLQHRTSKMSFVQLWTQGNYHWYLKQSLEFNSEEQPVFVNWFENRLDVVDRKGVYSQFEWAWATHRSRGRSIEDGAFVAVIDGAQLLLSSFRLAVPPPPMCTWTANLSCPINSIAFSPDESNRVCAVLSDGSLTFLDASKRQILQSATINWSSSHGNEIGTVHHWLWLSSKKLLCCFSNQRESNIYTIGLRGSEMNDAVVENTARVSGSVISLTSNSNKVILQLSNGQVFIFLPTTHQINRHSSLPEPCVQLELTPDDLIIALSSRSRLYFEGQEIANNVTSFLVRPPFILITTSQRRLICLKLEELKRDLHTKKEETFSSSNEVNEHMQNVDKFLTSAGGITEILGARNENPMGSSNSTAKSGRRLERGARLVMAVPKETRVILQMPRGNLETIQPRSLCLYVAAKFLDHRHYYAAFTLFRKQRINLNLLCDHQLDLFLDNATEFVKQVKDPSWLSIFFSELDEDDVTVTIYREHYKQPDSSSAKAHVDNKVARVCDKVREAMMAREDSQKYIQPIIASYVKQGFTGEALKIAAKDASALTFLSCMVDVDKLFDVALGLYDLELAAFVAARTQKDPKEYLPFLNNIHKLDGCYRRYVIDEHLKRYDLALKHIASCPGEKHLQESLALVKKHNLYKQALKLYPLESEGYKAIAAAYGEYLTTKLQHLEAAILFRRAGNDEKALNAFVLAGDWQEALTSATNLGYSSTQVDEFCRKRLVPNLINSRRHSEAAQIFKEVLNDVEECISVLIQGRLWDSAMWTIRQAKLFNMIEMHLKPGLKEHVQLLKDHLARTTETFHRHKTRLNVVRTAQCTCPIDMREDHVHDDCDLFSDRSSVATKSFATSSGRSSTRSSKNRRKKERKLLSLKEGGEFEELALIRALHELMKNAYALQDEVFNLCRVLLHFNCDEDASSLQGALKQILQDMDKSKTEIWTPELNSNQKMTFGPEATTDSIVSALQSGDTSLASSSLLDPHLRIPPNVSNSTLWQLTIL